MKKYCDCMNGRIARSLHLHFVGTQRDAPKNGPAFLGNGGVTNFPVVAPKCYLCGLPQCAALLIPQGHDEVGSSGGPVQWGPTRELRRRAWSLRRDMTRRK